MNMFKPSKATTVEEYYASLPVDRQEAAKVIHEFILKTAPSLKPYFAYNMPGYGAFKYRNYKNEVIDWPVISFASQKNYMSLYVCAVDKDGNYVAEKHKDELGKVNVGKSCIRFKKIADLDLEALGKVIKFAEKNPGLIGASQYK